MTYPVQNDDGNPAPARERAGAGAMRRHRALTYTNIVRLGLAQMALGAVVVLCTATLNRVMTVEYHLPATVPGALVALHYAIQILRPRMGFGSDRGGRRTPWITGGTAAMALASIAAAAAVPQFPAHPLLAGAASLAAFLLLGAGVGAAGTSLLALVADRAPPGRGAAAATILWIMMIAGIALTAGVASHALAPFSPARLLAVTAVVALAAILLALVATWRIEGAGEGTRPTATPTPTPFRRALQEIWAEPRSRRFALFVFVSMLAYSAQELLLEPLAGAVFALSPAQTAGLTGLLHAGVLAGMALVALATLLAGGYGRRSMRLCTTAGCLASAAGALAVAAITLAGAEPALAPATFALGAANGAFSVSAIGAMMGLARTTGDHQTRRDGTRIGLWGAAQALAFGAGGLIGTAASDAARAAIGAPAPAYALVFALEAAAFTAAALIAAGLFAQPRRPAAAPQSWTMELQP